MTSMGASLRAAREKKGLTLSEAAAATRIKYQIIDDLEHDNFRRTYAPIYAKGFIKIYGEYLGLDVCALLEAYAQEQASTAGRGDLESGAGLSSQSKSSDPEPHRLMAKPLRPSVRMIRRLPLKRWFERLKAICRALWNGWLPAAKTQIVHATRSTALWFEQTRQALHGRYRFHAAAVIVGCIFLLLLVITTNSLRRRGEAVDSEKADRLSDPTPVSSPVKERFELIHDPPPPYY